MKREILLIFNNSALLSYDLKNGCKKMISLINEDEFLSIFPTYRSSTFASSVLTLTKETVKNEAQTCRSKHA